MKSINSLYVAELAGAFAIAMLLSGGAHAESVSDFYGKTQVKMIVPSSPGGGYDTYARTLARHIGNHIPGHPRIIVQNMPGAGGVVAANWVYNVAPQDGSVISGFERTLPVDQIMGYPGPKYDPMKFQWLGSIANEAGVLAVLKSAKAKTLAGVFHVETILGSTGPTDSEIYPALMNNTLGAKFKLVFGYPGSSQVALAIKRGEVQGISESWSSFKQHMGPRFLRKNINVLVQLSLKPVPELTRMGVPMIMSVVDRKHVLPQYTVNEAKTWWRLMLTPKAMGRPYAVGPDVPDERVDALRTAFMDTMKDPAFLADARKQHRDVSPISGEEVEDLIGRIATAPKDVVAKVRDLIKYHGPVRRVKVSMVEEKGEVVAVKRSGRSIAINYQGNIVKAKVSGHRTKVTLDGRNVSRATIKAGMTCTFTYPGPGQEAKRVDCTG